MEIWLWIGFVAFVLVMLALDLGVFNRKVHVISGREALCWTGFWVSLAMLFNVAVYFIYQNHWLGFGAGLGGQAALSGKDAAMQFLAGYLIEESLSMDNIFVIALILTYFRVPQMYQHRVLFWGIMGALIMRGAMIGAGIALINAFEWIIYVFGLMLLASAIKLLLSKEEDIHPDRKLLVRIARRFYPVSSQFDGHKFFTRLNGRRALTPLALCLLVIEGTDLLFAVDSIPAVFAVTREPFIVFTSNIFAILGLRSLYFALAAILDKFHHLKLALVVLLLFIGVKMLLSPEPVYPFLPHYKISTGISLVIVMLVLAAGIVMSLLFPKKHPPSEKIEK